MSEIKCEIVKKVGVCSSPLRGCCTIPQGRYAVYAASEGRGE